MVIGIIVGIVAAVIVLATAAGVTAAALKKADAKADENFSKKPVGGTVTECPLKDKINVLPVIEPEYNVVIFDRNLSQFQDKSEKPATPDPVYINLSLKQDKMTEKFDKGAKLQCSPANIEWFEDKELKTAFDAAVPIPRDKLMDGGPLKLWMKANKIGKFEVALIPEDSANDKFILKKDVKKEMAVVELKMKVHRHDINEVKKLKINPDTDPETKFYDDLRALKLPDQVELSDEDKVKKGRVLHKQNGKSFGRMKLVIPKQDSAAWPANTDNYEITIDKAKDSAGGSMEVYDAEFDGAKLDLPAKVKKKDLLKAERELWVQGAGITNKAGELRIELGVDRPTAGVAKEPKHNADWARLTVVNIKEVKLSYIKPKNAPEAWNESDEKFYINTQKDPDGRKVKLKAVLEPKLQDIEIYFMLAEDADNRKKANWGEDFPSSWKWKDIKTDYKHEDKDNRKKLLHRSTKTDANGEAECEVMLSRWGGDIFTPSAYIEQDPHMAMFADGQKDLKERVPTQASKKIKVWRKFWYQVTEPDGFNAPAPSAAETTYSTVKADMTLDNKVSFKEADAPARTYYKKYIVVGGNDDTKVAVIGSHNKNGLAAKYVANPKAPLKNHLIMCRYQYDEDWKKVGGSWKRGTTGLKSKNLTSAPAGAKVKIKLGGVVFDPPLQGGSMVKRVSWRKVKQPAVKGTIPAGNVQIPKPRSGQDEVEITLPGAVPTPSAADPIQILIECFTADGPYLGESFDKNSLIVFDGSDVADYNDTIAHEIGHAFNQTPPKGDQPDTIPEHPFWFTGQGTHCKFDNKKCVMYESGPQATAIHLYCEKCHPYLLIEDMSKFK